MGGGGACSKGKMTRYKEDSVIEKGGKSTQKKKKAQFNVSEETGKGK